jgi:hypothetical protein
MRLACVLLFFAVVAVRYTVGPTEETLTPSVSSRIATHSNDATYAVVAEQRNRSIDVNGEFQRLKNLRQYPKIIALARTRRAELDLVISKVQRMGLVAQERDRVLTLMHEERNQMTRVIAAVIAVR